MRSLRDCVIALGMCAGVLSGCGPTTEPCPRPVGNYVATYGLLNGTCTRAVGMQLTFPDEDRAQIINSVSAFGGPIITELNRLGCTVSLKQDWTEMGSHVSVQGQLSVDDKATLTGELSYQEYMPDGTTMRCQSLVDANYALADGIPVGEAARAALAAE